MLRKRFLWLVVLVSFLSVIGWFAVVHTLDRRICSSNDWSCHAARYVGTQLSHYPVTSVSSVSLLQTTSSGQLNGSNLSVSPHSSVLNDSTAQTGTPATQPGRTLGSLAVGKDTTEPNSPQLPQLRTAVDGYNEETGESRDALLDTMRKERNVLSSEATTITQTTQSVSTQSRYPVNQNHEITSSARIQSWSESANNMVSSELTNTIQQHNTITDSQLGSDNAVTDPMSVFSQDMVSSMTDDSNSPSSSLTKTSTGSTQSIPSTQLSTNTGRKLQFVFLPKVSANNINHSQFQSKLVNEQHQSQGSRPFSFEIHDPFHLPQSVATKSVEELLQTEWMGELKEFLKGVQSPDPIALVTSDYNYRGVLLNWIIKAKIAVDSPINNIMVLSLDLYLFELLKSKKVSCIYVEPASFLKPTVKLDRHVAFSEAMIIRLTVMRFINHWGFDVVNYDSDALVMRNPGPIFDQHKGADIMGSYGSMPQGIRDKWGIVLCMGLIMIRSSPQTELFWETFTNSAPESFNDQARLNIALYTLELKFKDHGFHDRQSIETETWEAEGRDGLSVIVLPATVVCRQTCKISRNKQVHYYIWHRGGKPNQESKARYAAQAGLWNLRENWEQITKNTTATGDVWLKSISTY